MLPLVNAQIPPPNRNSPRFQDQTMPSPSQCSLCSRTNVPLHACTRCKITLYCAKECQARDWASHKAYCRRPNYLVKAHIDPDALSSDPIWRILSVPATTSFAALHQALQIAFGWKSIHSYEFGVHDPEYEPLAGGDERVVEVMKKIQNLTKRNNESRKYLLRIVDDAKYGSKKEPADKARRYAWEHPRTPEKNASQIILSEVFDTIQPKGIHAHKTSRLLLLNLRTGLHMSYTYDYANRWVHDILLLGIAPATKQIQCIDGEGHGIAEDCGGITGWQSLLAAYQTSTPTKQQWEMRKWFEKVATNADPQGLLNGGTERWNRDQINLMLEQMDMR